jgi:glucose-6-phosphate 1-dehydrogenase
MDHEEYLKRVKSYIKTPTQELEKQLEEFVGYCSYVSGQYDKDESFVELEKHLQELEKGRKENNRIFYMALPPSVFITVSQHLKRNNYPKNGISRVIVSIGLAATLNLATNHAATGREALRQGPSELPRAPKRTCP